jgi:hypothetical protein
MTTLGFRLAADHTYSTRLAIPAFVSKWAAFDQVSWVITGYFRE